MEPCRGTQGGTLITGAGFHDETASGRSAIVAVAGVALTALYAATTWRLLLPEFFPEAGVSLDWIKMLAPDRQGAAVAYLVVVLAASALYALVLFACWRHAARIPRVLLFGFPVLFAASLLLMYPPTAVDLFHYHADARTLWIYELNPLVVPPAETNYPIGISWADQPSPYGPVWSLLTGVLAPLMVFGDHLLATLVGFKLLATASYLGCAWLIYRLVQRTRPGLELWAFVLFAWNPFVLLRVVGNGHNDLVMVFFALLALSRAHQRDWTLAFPLLALSVLIKYSTALLGLPLLLFAWFAIEGRAVDRVRTLAPGVALAGIVTVFAYLPFWAGTATFDTVTRQTELMVTSTPDVLRSLWEDNLGDEAASNLARRIGIGTFLLLVVPLTWPARRGFDSLVMSSFNLLFFYLLIASAWFRPWYMLWPAAIILLRPTRWGVALFLAITFANLFPDLIEQYRYDWGLEGNFQARLAPTAAQFVLPLAVWIAGAISTRSWSLGAASDEPGAPPGDLVTGRESGEVSEATAARRSG